VHFCAAPAFFAASSQIFSASVFALTSRDAAAIRLDDTQLAAVQFFDLVGGDLHRRAMAGIVPKNVHTAIQRRVDNAVQVFWNGIKVDGPA
jgi:hypothetical protein